MNVPTPTPGYNYITTRSGRRAAILIPNKLQPVNGKHVVVFSADSTCLAWGNKGTAEVKMGSVNGLDKFAAYYGFAVVHLLPQYRYFGAVYAWNQAGQFMHHRRGLEDDGAYLREVAIEVERQIRVSRFVALGFGDGVQYLQLNPALFADVVSIQGTRLETEPPLEPGTGFWWCHGQNNVVLPLAGGYGGPFKLYFRLTASRHAKHSKPWAQMEAACAANGLSYGRVADGPGQPDPEYPYALRYDFGGASSNGRVIARILTGPGDGHCYPGRALIESAVSKKQGGAPSPFPANQIWPRELLGMEPLVPGELI